MRASDHLVYQSPPGVAKGVRGDPDRPALLVEEGVYNSCCEYLRPDPPVPGGLIRMEAG